MVFYVSSPKYQPMINKILSETDQVCVGNEVGEDIYIKKYVKEHITLFEQIELFVIDMTALADTDQEVMQSIESLRVMDYKTRFIILAPYKKEGDEFFKKCFYAGIYDIINTDEYLEMSQQLTLCISSGMRYKDALHFRDADPGDEQKQESMAVQKILIGIVGAGRRMGSTHNSIVLANSLRENNQMVAIMEMNDTKAFQKACEAQKAKIFDEGYFSLQGVDYYPESDRERVISVSGKLYNFLILDFGNYEECDKVMFNKCDVRLVFCGTKSWEMDCLENIFKEQDEDVLQKYHFCFLGTTSTKLQKEIISHMQPLENVWFPEYTEDPFVSSKFPEAEQIFKGYLGNLPKQKEKKRLLFQKR